MGAIGYLVQEHIKDYRDITTLADLLDHVQKMTACYLEEVYCNKGYMSKKVHKNLQFRVFTPKTENYSSP